jgi:hypothetical protein
VKKKITAIFQWDFIIKDGVEYETG